MWFRAVMHDKSRQQYGFSTVKNDKNKVKDVTEEGNVSRSSEQQDVLSFFKLSKLLNDCFVSRNFHFIHSLKFSLNGHNLILIWNAIAHTLVVFLTECHFIDCTRYVT